MNHSSRQNPCPCCFRDVDDKCRFGDDLILCYNGDSFHPPANLVVGDCIKIAGHGWKLLRMNAGFAANSFLFVRSDDESTLTPLQRRRLRREQKSIEWKKEFKQIRDLVYCSFSTPRFDLIDDADFLEYKQATDLALEKTEKLLSLLSMNRRRVYLKKYTIVALGYWRKTLGYQKRDFECRARKLGL